MRRPYHRTIAWYNPSEDQVSNILSKTALDNSSEVCYSNTRIVLYHKAGAQVTNSELAILSLLAEQSRHGYDIERVISERGMREWTEIGFSSIYYLLKKLGKEGMLEGQLEKSEHGPARKVYHLTPAGRKALRAGVLHALSVPGRCYPPWQLGLASLPTISPADAVTALRQYRDALAARRKHVRVTLESQSSLPYFVKAMFSHSVTMLEAELAWVEQFIEQMEERKET